MLDLLAALAAASTPVPGDSVTYLLGDTARCAQVAYVDRGADGRTWAWIVGGSAPQWTFHVPLQELSRGCVEGRHEAKK